MMKKTFIAATIALSSILISGTSHATPVTATNSDVFVGFENTAGTLNYLYDLGNAATFAAAVQNHTFSSVSLNADLVTVFGSGWATSSTTALQFGLFNIAPTKSVVYASVATGDVAPDNTLTANGLATTAQHFTGMWQNYNTDILGGQGLTLGVKMNVGTSPDLGFSTWTGNSPALQNGSAFAAYNTAIETGVSGKLDFYSTTAALNLSTPGTSTLLGSLQISTAGVFSVVAVPEPSTYALFALGACMAFLGIHRRMKGSSKV